MNGYGVERFRAETVISHGLRVLGRNVVSFVALALAALLVFAVAAVVLGFVDVVTGSPDPEQIGVGTLLLVPLFFLLFMLLTAALTYSTYREMRGDPVGPVACLSRVLPRFLPMVGVGLVAFVAVMGGMLLLIVPGLIVATMLWVAIPVVVIEELGVRASIARSRALTAGYRLQIFAVLFVIGALDQLSQRLLVYLFEPESIAMAVVGTTLSTLFVAVQAIMPAVGYFHLRSIKEGVGVEDIAAVFD